MSQKPDRSSNHTFRISNVNEQAENGATQKTLDTDDELTYDNNVTNFQLTTQTANLISKTLNRTEELVLSNLKVDENNLVKLNLCGTSFLVPKARLKKNPILYQKLVEDAIFVERTNEYFLDRDPLVFQHVLSYLRHGQLHLPESICGPLINKELDLWGIPMGLDIQRCCLGRVTDSKLTLQALEKFEKYFSPIKYQPSVWIKSVKWQNFRDLIWNVLNLSPEMIEPIAKDNMRNSTENSVEFDESRRHKEEYHNLRVRNQSMQRLGNILNKNITVDRRTRVACQICFGYIVYQILLISLSYLTFIMSSLMEFQYIIVLDNTIEMPRNCSATNLYPNHYLDAFHKGCFIDTISWVHYTSYISSLLFSIDLLFRFIFTPKYIGFITFYNMIDLLSILPFWAEILVLRHSISSALSAQNYTMLENILYVMEMFNYIRITIALRILRFLLKYTATRVLFYSIQQSWKDMAVLIVLIIITMTVFGAGVFFADKDIANVPWGMWFALITMTSVGYGDIIPRKTVSVIITSFLVVTGLLLTSYVIPIIVNNFAMYYQHASQLEYLVSLHEKANLRHKEQYIKYLSTKVFKRIRHEKHNKKEQNK